MIYGITTSRAHLDALDQGLYPLDPSEPGDREIDWSELFQWLWQADSTTGLAAFAGRYFLGAATDAEVNDGAAFCLWAHGEAADPNAPKVVPIQRADPVRQSTGGPDGLAFGALDATELAGHLDRCLAVGELEVVNTKQILVFLEVADGTQLSIEYWAAWASTLHDAILSPARLANRTGAEATQLLLPAVLCAFAFDEEAGAFLPEPAVRACLDKIGPSGYRTHCHGLWARRLAGDPGLAAHTFDWTTIGEYRQPRAIVGVTTPYMHRVPVRYLRWFDGPDGLPIPAGALRDTLSLLTIEWPAGDGDDPLGASFTPTDWSASRRDAKGNLVELPSQFGFDTGARVTAASAACLARTEVTVTSLPCLRGGTPVNLHGPCAVAIRYYRPAGGGRALNAAESAALSVNGIQTAVIWQHTATLTRGWAAYVNDLIGPFVNGRGRDDGKAAFTYAADTIGQPPYTPVYFAIDFPVGNPGYTDGRPGSVPVATPSLPTIVTYFEDIRRGYRDYLATHPTTPYYVGVYTWPVTAAALYRAGLVSHFWQPPWGAGTPFPHLNVWQIGMFSSPQVPIDNASLQACAPGGGAGQPFWVDIDVAWGDPGGFVT